MAAQNAVSRWTSGRSTMVAIAAIWIVVGMALLNDALKVVTVTTGRVLFAIGGAEGRLPLSYLPQLLQADLREGATGFLTDAPLWLRILCASPFLAHAVTITVAAIVVVRIVRRIAAAQPFTASVLRDWKLASVALIGGGVAQGLLDTVAVTMIFELAKSGMSMDDHPLGADYSGIGTNFPQWPFFMILLGIVAAAISSAFRSGARLEEEVVGVV